MPENKYFLTSFYNQLKNINIKYSLISRDNTNNGSAVSNSHCTQRTPCYTGMMWFSIDLNTDISVLEEQTKV